MWKRNLLAMGLALVGLGLFLASVFPPPFKPETPLAVVDFAGLEPVVAQIDAAFAQQWQQEGLTPALPADDLTVARRLSLALAGTVPSLAEIRQLEAQPAAERRNWWLAKLLADPRSHDYLAERFARALVGTEGGNLILFRRRRFVSWLADELGKNRPYDQLARQMIAAQGIWTTEPAVNFVTAAIEGEAEKPNPSVLAVRVSRAFLGNRLDCAECHDHPFADWKQDDFHGIAAFFGQATRDFRGLIDKPAEYQIDDLKTGQPRTISPAVPYLADQLPQDGPRRQRLAAWVTSPQNKPFARATVNRVWAILFGLPLVDPIDDLPYEAADLPPALELLADDFITHGYDLRRLIATVASLRVFALDSRNEPSPPGRGQGEGSWSVFPLVRLRPEQVAGSLLQAASLQTIDYDSNILVQLARFIGQREFIERYGDTGADEFAPRGGTIPQRLLLMNGQLARERFSPNPLPRASMRVAELAPTDEQAVEVAMLCVLTRRPTADETNYFAAQLNGTRGEYRQQAVADMYWTLLNCTEFAWNH